MEKQHEINLWAKKYVPRFNELGKKSGRSFYTQSPLLNIDGDIETMIIGINPGSTGEYTHEISADEYLKGNFLWDARFLSDGKPCHEWRPYLNGVHTFFGYSNEKQPQTLENDKITVWTNLTPFDCHNGYNGLNNDLLDIGIKSTLDLIKVLNPNRIVLLSVKAFELLKKYSEGIEYVDYKKTFHNHLQVGRIGKIPTYGVRHPSTSKIPYRLTTLFLQFMIDNDIKENGILKYSIDEIIELFNNNEEILSVRKKLGLPKEFWQKKVSKYLSKKYHYELYEGRVEFHIEERCDEWKSVRDYVYSHLKDSTEIIFDSWWGSENRRCFLSDNKLSEDEQLKRLEQLVQPLIDEYVEKKNK